MSADEVKSGMKRRGGWTVAWAQITGVHHSVCEDRLAHRVLKRENAGGLCLAVADGVGGGARGDVAAEALARHCVDVPAALIGKSDTLAQWMRMAEGQVQLRLREVTFSPGAATLVAAWLDADGKGHLMHVGDCRAYRYGNGLLEVLTEDQTYTHIGEKPPEGVPTEAPARMVGTGCMGEPNLRPLSLSSGETLLLCSDGLHRDLETSKIAETLLSTSKSLQTVCIALVNAARQAGSEDDITVQLARRSIGVGIAAQGWRWLLDWSRRLMT